MSQERSGSRRTYLTRLRELLVERFGDDDLRTLFELTKLDTLFSIVDTTPQALAAF